jgi:Flp pilus assembly secretin CpaC
MNSEDYNRNDRNIVVATATINGGNFTILVLPNLGGISGQLTKTTRGNHTAGQTVRLPHTEKRQT